MRINFERLLRVLGVGILLSQFLVGCGEKSLPPVQPPNKVPVTITGNAV